MAKLTDEEKIIRAELKRRSQKTEQQLVHEYANQVMDRKASRGHYDKRFDWHKRDGATNKDLWFDSDFFFSVVFQSEAQKYEFLSKLSWQTDDFEQVQIVNGLALAKKLGIDLKPETALPYPYTDLELRDLVLDSDDF